MELVARDGREVNDVQKHGLVVPHVAKAARVSGGGLPEVPLGKKKRIWIDGNTNGWRCFSLAEAEIFVLDGRAAANPAPSSRGVVEKKTRKKLLGGQRGVATAVGRRAVHGEGFSRRCQAG